MDRIELQAFPRTILGKKVKQLRREGFTPVNLYGPHRPSQALQVETRSLRHTLARAGKTSLIHLRTDSEEEAHPVLVRGIQLDPRTRNLLHVDFYEVKLTEKVRAEVPLHFVGQSPAANSGGVLIHLLTQVEVECLPQDMPHALEVDISSLKEFSQAIHVREIPVPKEVTILADPEEMVEPPRKLEEVAAEVEAPTEEALPEAEAPQMEQPPPEEG
jgi:large subunit ribosomal protein L25